MLSIGVNNLPQFDEGNMMYVEFISLNLKYLSLNTNSLLESQNPIGSKQR